MKKVRLDDDVQVMLTNRDILAIWTLCTKVNRKEFEYLLANTIDQLEGSPIGHALEEMLHEKDDALKDLLLEMEFFIEPLS